MIARIWNGKTLLEHKEAYIDFMKSRALSDYQNTEGFVKLEFLCQAKGGLAYFKLITFWENLEVIQNFAGEDYEKAKYYPEDDGFLLDFPEKVKHYEVFASTD